MPVKKLAKKDFIDQFVFFLQRHHPEFFIFEMNYLERKLFIESFFDCIEQELYDALTSKRRIEIRDFGVWFLRKTKRREINNPIQEKKLIISERVIPKFRAGKNLLEKLNAEIEQNKNEKDNQQSIFKKYFKKVFSRT